MPSVPVVSVLSGGCVPTTCSRSCFRWVRSASSLGVGVSRSFVRRVFVSPRYRSRRPRCPRRFSVITVVVVVVVVVVAVVVFVVVVIVAVVASVVIVVVVIVVSLLSSLSSLLLSLLSSLSSFPSLLSLPSSESDSVTVPVVELIRWSLANGTCTYVYVPFDQESSVSASTVERRAATLVAEACIWHRRLSGDASESTGRTPSIAADGIAPDRCQSHSKRWRHHPSTRHR